ncbi:hypothetical protein [uncultured Parasutterella sp.]|uniref:hypothetical protein n=1 Tax=uncultured Parasutterella sp. TaxID=1263098 RepID=UPI00204D9CF6|nr:hypothetical protein [uncultured Parasutterella sp.]DAJ56234.1 MAG TPA: hypothetical protein [Caudoviricetes sp.]
MKIRRYFWARPCELIVVAEDFKNYAVSVKDQTFGCEKIPALRPPIEKEFPSDCETLEQKRSYLEALIKIGAMESLLEEV